jgi:hypothetical protein
MEGRCLSKTWLSSSARSLEYLWNCAAEIVTQKNAVASSTPSCAPLQERQGIHGSSCCLPTTTTRDTRRGQLKSNTRPVGCVSGKPFELLRVLSHNREEFFGFEQLPEELEQLFELYAIDPDAKAECRRRRNPVQRGHVLIHPFAMEGRALGL